MTDARDLTQTDPQLRHRHWLVEVESPIWGTQTIERFPGVLRDAGGDELDLAYVALALPG